MKIGIIGIGIVGTAVMQSFTKKGLNVVVYDKYKNIGNIEDVLSTDFIFLCLPTLYNRDNTTYDKSAIYEICQYLSSVKYDGLVIIKSTIEPTISESIADSYGLHIIHNPEFLTARTAYLDFHHQQHIIIGTTKNIPTSKIEILNKFFHTNYPDAKITICKAVESESTKIFCNCFYAVKIQFFNELYLLCQKIGADYETIRKTMLNNNWINPMHTMVPGPDGQLSYGGFCFPKDTNALLSFMKIYDSPCSILDATVQEHDILRTD